MTKKTPQKRNGFSIRKIPRIFGWRILIANGTKEYVFHMTEEQIKKLFLDTYLNKIDVKRPIQKGKK